MATALDSLAKKLSVQAEADGFESDYDGEFNNDEHAEVISQPAAAAVATVTTTTPVVTSLVEAKPQTELDAREMQYAFELDSFNRDKKAKLDKLQAAYIDDDTALYEKHRDEIGQTLEGSLKRSLLHGRQVNERITLQDTMGKESELLESLQFPDYETWELSGYKSGDVLGELINTNHKLKQPIPTDIRSFKSKELKGEVVYYKSESLLKKPTVNFADDGYKVKVYLIDDEQTILAALQLASQKELGAPFDIKGSKTFCDLCKRVALKHGIATNIPEVVGNHSVEKTQVTMNSNSPTP